MAKFLKQNKKTASAKALERARKKIWWQMGLAGVTVLLTVVIIFAMTSAWYTNIVQTSGLTFQAESWGFDGSVSVSEASIQAAPGDEGEVYLQVVNSSDSISSVSVGVVKPSLTGSNEMKELGKRMFVYVDTQAMRSGEAVERVYLNSQESYTYTLFSKGTLTLSQEIHTDAPLKWQWVYDMLGYYVLGTWDEDKTRFTEVEYLRPIEYDYDEATFTMTEDENGIPTMELATVDGKTSPEDFLRKLSEHDGYEGTVKTDLAHEGYYPVEVDDSGYGVYAYLCSYSEIQMATQFDTFLGEEAAKFEAGVEGASKPPAYPVQLTVSAQKNDENILAVDSLADLNAAMDMGISATLQLENDLVLTAQDTLTVPAGKQLVLDLNGNSIVSSNGNKSIVAEPGSSLTVLNGSITPAQGVTPTYGVQAVGAEVTLSGVTVEGFNQSIYINDYSEGNALDSRIRIVDSYIDGNTLAVFVSGNGTASGQKSQVVIEKSTLIGGYYALLGNGSSDGNGRWGTDIQVISCVLETKDTSIGSAGIFHPQKNSTITVYRSEVTGYNGIVMKGGELIIQDSKIYGKGKANEAGFAVSGYTDTGDAVYVETGYGYDIRLEIKGDDTLLRSSYSKPLQVFEEDSPNVTVIIHSGEFSPPESLKEEYLAEGSTLSGSKVIAPTEPAETTE